MIPRCPDYKSTIIFSPNSFAPCCSTCGLEIPEEVLSPSVTSHLSQTDADRLRGILSDYSKENLKLTSEEKRMQYWIKRVESRYSTWKQSREDTIRRDFRKIFKKLHHSQQMIEAKGFAFEDGSRRNFSEQLREELVKLVKKLSQKGILKEGGKRTIGDFVFEELYRTLWNEYTSYFNKQMQAQMRLLRENLSLSNLTKRLKTQVNPFSFTVDFYWKMIEELETIFPDQVKSQFDTKLLIYRKLEEKMKNKGIKVKYYYYIPFLVDPNIVHTRKENLYQLFNLTRFKGVKSIRSPKNGGPGEIVKDRRKLRVKAAENYVNVIKNMGLTLFHAFMFTQPLELWNKKRRGLACACIYVASYIRPWMQLKTFSHRGGLKLRHMRFISLTKQQRKWWSFYGISKRTFLYRLRELKRVYPNIEPLIKAIKKMQIFYRETLEAPLSDYWRNWLLFEADFTSSSKKEFNALKALVKKVSG